MEWDIQRVGHGIRYNYIELDIYIQSEVHKSGIFIHSWSYIWK